MTRFWSERRAPAFKTWHAQALSEFEAIRDVVGQVRLSLNMERSLAPVTLSQELLFLRKNPVIEGGGMVRYCIS